MELSKEAQARKLAGARKAGKTTGQSKNRMKHLTAEERSQRMREVVQKRWEKYRQLKADKENQ